MIITANAYLGRTHDDDAIGYQVLTVNRNPLRLWTAERVARTAPGWWAVAGGVEMPDAGGFIAWGLEGQPALAEDAIDPAPNPTPEIVRQVNGALTTLVERIRQLLPAPPPIIVETAHFDGAVAAIAETVTASNRQYLERLATVAETLAALQEVTSTLTVLNDGANQVIALAEMQRRLNGILGEPTPGLRAVTEMSVSPLVNAVEALHGDLVRVAETATEGKRAVEKRQRTAAALDKLIAQLEGRQS